MRDKPELHAGMTIEDVMRIRPETIPVLLRNRMHCVGCLLAPFHDISDAAREHGLDEAELIGQLSNS
ncbi:hybrid cluster-associated redox disulfide protein [Hoeflea marina]|uniref:Hybrid cluster-associated redox disulfide protein n=1 Tax=Hoeflea marina TaxID=274592 RepID=A0A317PJS1_9HYPH|nr:DUF1858 domain-containing protein [Hoeflea marina]PWW00583.1 hybrid cluster-associated redox disulfide protein [Hoeflea marina]